MESDLSAAKQKNIGKSLNPHSNQLLEAVFNNVQEGVLIVDKDGNLTNMNQEGARIHGLEYSDKEFYLNKPFNFFRILNDERQELPECRGPVVRLLTPESFSNEQYIVQVYENSPEIRISYSGLPQFNHEGNFTAGILFARKVSDKSLQSELIKDVFTREEHIKQLETYQQQLKEDRELLQVIIETIPVMVTIYDGRIQSFAMNQAFETTTGWTKKDLAEKNIMELVYPDSAYRKEIVDFMKSLQPGFKDIVMRTKEGRDIETSWANVKIPDGRQVGVGIDISERKRLERELINARERAEKENEVQYAFIQNISHEVRTPMNSILGFTELLQKELTRKKDLEFLNAISYNGKQLLRLIDDIIDFSQLDNNQVSMQKEVLNLNNMMKQIELQIEGMKKAYRKRHLRIQMKHPADNVQAILKTDRFRLQQVLLNLLGNAIKYTEEGDVEIGYEVRAENHDILFYVKDTGIGIGADDEKRVFKRFNRLHDTNSQEFRGTGLGLAISKHLVNLLGGEIWFRSKQGNGTVFYFSHPYQELQSITPNPDINVIEDRETPAETILPDLSDKVILIVEDDSFSYMMMYHMLEESKAIILHADTGRKAIEIFEKYKTDMVFLDIRLPEMDGYQVIKYMHQVNSAVPVIAQTANALPEDKRRITEAGFDYHITKPISRDGLVNVLKKFL